MKQLILNIIAYAVQRNVDITQACKLSGIHLEDLTKADSPAPNEQQLEALWLNAGRLAGDPLFGLHLGESLRPAALGIVGMIIQNSATVGEAITHAAGLIHIVTDKCRMEIRKEKGKFEVYLIPAENEIAKMPNGLRQLMDMLMVMVVHEMDGLVLEKIEPASVQLPYPIENPSEYERIFRCRVARRSGEYSMAFDNRYWDIPILTANYELQELLLKKVRKLPQTKKNPTTYKARIYNYLLANSYLGLVSLEDIAANFNVTPRSLQRRLKEEEVSFQDIADEVRRSLAEFYISSGNYALKDISRMLGYNELSAFTRAFKRWTGQSPTVFRAA